MYKVSIIIPIYNVSKYIEMSLMSALNQNFDSIEYILVDDCGSDDSMAIVVNMVANHYRSSAVKIIRHEHNRGLSAARNTGLSHASGDFIFFMDSDDEISLDCIQLLYAHGIESNSDVVVGNVKLVGAKSIHIRPIYFNQLDNEESFLLFLKKKFPVSAWGKLYSRNFLTRNSLIFVEGIQHEDILFSFYLTKANPRVTSINKEIYLYKIRKDSITTNKVSLKRLQDLQFILSTIQDTLCKEKSYLPEGGNYIEYLIFLISLQAINSSLNLSGQKAYYNQLRSLTKTCGSSKYAKINKLPFILFKIMIGIPYKAYKFVC